VAEEQGPQGVQGSQGAQGVQGLQGVQGTQGPAAPRGPQGAQGQRGHEGRPGVMGRAGAPGISAGTRRAAIGLLVLVLIVGAGNLVASYDQVQSFKNQLRTQQVAEEITGAREIGALCSDVGTMAAIPAPAGNPAANPSRAYEQAEARAWSGLVGDLGCSKLPGRKR
jgi:Collagen triple helix repeat (20 copies)